MPEQCMICVVQRVLRGKVTVAGEVVGQIEKGLLVLAAVEVRDADADIAWTAAKLAGLRIFRSADGAKYFDQDVKQVGGAILLVSNFTVAAETASGRRPSLSNAAPPEVGRNYFDKLVDAVRAQGVRVETGRFGAEMEIELVNDGPVTFLVESPVGPKGSMNR
jgi:D-tyrosyl-tRNA(Tyr) deacylase